jgi:hypothetical protein
VHLRAADPLGDLSQGEVLVVAEAYHFACAGVEIAEEILEEHGVFDARVSGVQVALGVRPLTVDVGHGVGRCVAAGDRLHGLAHVVLAALQDAGDLTGRVGLRPVPGTAGLQAVHRPREVLQRARRSHQPSVVAEMATQLAEDGREGVGGQRGSTVGIPVLKRPHKPDGRDLHQVVERLAAIAVPAREPMRQR